MLTLRFQHEVTGAKEGAIRNVNFNIDGEYCLTCSSDKTLQLWNPFKKILLKRYIGHGQEVLDADSASDCSKLTSCSADRTVVYWDVESGKVMRKYRGHLSKVNTVRFNQPDSSLIFSSSYDCTIRCWDSRSRSMEPIQVLDDAKDSISSLTVSDHEILTGSVDGYVRVYDIRQGKLQEDCIGESITSVTFSSDGQCILASSLDNTIRLIDKETGCVLNKFVGHLNKDYKVECCISRCDSYIISGSEDGKLYIWDLVKAEVLHKIDDAHKGVINSLSIHPEKDLLLSAGADSVKLWSLTEEEIE